MKKTISTEFISWNWMRCHLRIWLFEHYDLLRLYCRWIHRSQTKLNHKSHYLVTKGGVHLCHDWSREWEGWWSDIITRIVFLSEIFIQFTPSKRAEFIKLHLSLIPWSAKERGRGSNHLKSRCGEEGGSKLAKLGSRN